MMIQTKVRKSVSILLSVLMLVSVLITPLNVFAEEIDTSTFPEIHIGEEMYVDGDNSQYLKFTAPEDGILNYRNIEETYGGGRAYNSDWEELTAASNNGDSSSFSHNYLVKEGETYYLYGIGAYDFSHEFLVTVDFTPISDTPQLTRAELFTAKYDWEKDVRFYRYTAKKSEKLSFTTKNFDPDVIWNIFLYDSDFNCLVSDYNCRNQHKIEYSVTEGETYVFAMAPDEPMHKDVYICPEPEYVELQNEEVKTVEIYGFTGEQWFKYTAQNNGYIIIYRKNPGEEFSINTKLYDADMKIISEEADNYRPIDVSSGEDYYIYVGYSNTEGYRSRFDVWLSFYEYETTESTTTEELTEETTEATVEPTEETLSDQPGPHERPLITDIVPADADTNTFYFYMPQEWRNDLNDVYDGKSLDSCKAGIFWWDGSYSCMEPENQGGTGKAWPGYVIPDTEPADSNIFVAKVPMDSWDIIFNNTVDGGSDQVAPEYLKAIQTTNIGTENYRANEDGYGFYPDGIKSFDGMIYVCDPKSTEVNGYNDKKTYKGAWLYYYGNGEYGINKEPVEGEIYSNGKFPKYGDEVDETEPTETASTAPTQGTTATDPTEGTTATAPTEGTTATDPTEGTTATKPTEIIPTETEPETIPTVSLGYEILDDDTAEITALIGGDVTEFEIPDTIDGHTVTSIGEGAFSGRRLLTSITIPNTVTRICDGAFSNCDKLENVVIPDSVRSVGFGVLRNTMWYENQPDGVVYAGKVAFTCKGTVPENVAIKEGTIAIEDGLFFNCLTIKSVTIPDSVLRIDVNAFFKCYNLTSVAIGNKVESIGRSAFDECISLTSVTIPSSVTSIGECAFMNCYSLTSADLSNSHIKHLSENVFYGCEKLKSITIPNTVKSIGDSAFQDCKGLETVVIPDSVTSIGNQAFTDCESLKSVTIGKNVTSMGRHAFSGCTGLTGIKIPNSVTSIGYGVFSGCSNLTSVTMPDTVTNIGEGMFMGCSKLTSFVIPNSVTSIGGSAFSGCSSLESVTTPNSVTSIGTLAFSGCSSLESVTIPNSVTSIGTRAFADCNRLLSVTIPDSVTSIDNYAFGYHSFRFDVDYGLVCSRVNGFTIKGHSGTEAEKYAKDNKFAFVDLASSAPKPEKTTVTVKNAPKTLYVKGTAKINATVKNGKGKTTYKSSDKKVAKVSSNGKITALKKGTAIITVTNNGVSKKLTIKVKNPTLNKTKKTLKKGGKFTLTVTGKVGKQTYTSNNKKVATVNKNGKITAKKKGNAIITVKTNGMKLKCSIKVK